MYVINEPGANNALAAGIDYLLVKGIEETSRNGPVLVAPGPVTTVYERPRERVLLSPTRDASPFFHLLGDALWCLSGSKDIAWPVSFVKKYADYSDDGLTQHGAYGDRWKWHFKKRGAHDINQLDWIVAELTEKPESRQAVLTMWDPAVDLRRIGKDIPCNTQVYFDCRGGVLNMTVLCRSNDIIWGAYGANVVQFSILQEYMAAKIGVPVGVYRQMSNNFHLYTETFGKEKLSVIIDESDEAADRYETLPDGPADLIWDPGAWDSDLKRFMMGDDLASRYTEPFFVETAVPMLITWRLHKLQQYGEALSAADQIAAPDWRWACEEWIQRRKTKFEETV